MHVCITAKQPVTRQADKLCPFLSSFGLGSFLSTLSGPALPRRARVILSSMAHIHRGAQWCFKNSLAPSVLAGFLFVCLFGAKVCSARVGDNEAMHVWTGLISRKRFVCMSSFQWDWRCAALCYVFRCVSSCLSATVHDHRAGACRGACQLLFMITGLVDGSWVSSNLIVTKVFMTISLLN